MPVMSWLIWRKPFQRLVRCVNRCSTCSILSIAEHINARMNTRSVNSGSQAGTSSAEITVAIEGFAGSVLQKSEAVVAVANRADTGIQGFLSVAISNLAGNVQQGDYSVAIGNHAGQIHHRAVIQFAFTFTARKVSSLRQMARVCTSSQLEGTQTNEQLYYPVSGEVTCNSGFAVDTQPTTTLTPSCTTTKINTLLPTALNDDSNCFTIDSAIASALSSYSTTAQTAAR